LTLLVMCEEGHLSDLYKSCFSNPERFCFGGLWAVAVLGF